MSTTRRTTSGRLYLVGLGLLGLTEEVFLHVLDAVHHGVPAQVEFESKDRKRFIVFQLQALKA